VTSQPWLALQPRPAQQPANPPTALGRCTGWWRTSRRVSLTSVTILSEVRAALVSALLLAPARVPAGISSHSSPSTTKRHDLGSWLSGSTFRTDPSIETECAMEP
jgi:hypothetical protein